MWTHTLRAGMLLGLATTGLVAMGLVGPVALADTDDRESFPAADTEPFLAAPSMPLNPGQELQIDGYCPDAEPGLFIPDALTVVDFRHDPAAAPPNLFINTVVAEDAEPGVYRASMDCAGQTLVITTTVVEPDDPAQDLPADFLAINPTSARPGEEVAAQARCAGADEVTLTSPVLHSARLVHDSEGHQPWALHATTTVIEDAKPGDYPVSAECSGETMETTITVLGKPVDKGKKIRDDDRQVTRVPVGAPETGDGERNLSLPMLAVGLGLGAAAGAGAIAWREARR